MRRTELALEWQSRRSDNNGYHGGHPVPDDDIADDDGTPDNECTIEVRADGQQVARGHPP